MEDGRFVRQRSGLYSMEIRPSHSEGIFIVRSPEAIFRVGNFALIHGFTAENVRWIELTTSIEKTEEYIRPNTDNPGEHLVFTSGSLKPLEGGRAIRFRGKIWEYEPDREWEC